MRIQSVVNSIIQATKARGILLNPLKVNYLAYLVASRYMSQTGHPLLDRPYIASKFGPKIDPLNAILQQQKEKGETEVGFVRDQDGKVSIVQHSNTDFYKVLDFILDRFGRQTGPALSALCMQNGTPWEQTRLEHEIDSRAMARWLDNYMTRQLQQNN